LSEPGKEGKFVLNQERKDLRIGRIMLKEKKKFVSEPGKKILYTHENTTKTGRQRSKY